MAALGVEEQVKRLEAEAQDRDGVDLRLRVGLNSGQVIADIYLADEKARAGEPGMPVPSAPPVTSAAHRRRLTLDPNTRSACPRGVLRLSITGKHAVDI